MKIRRILAVFLLAVLLSGLLSPTRAYAIADPNIQAKAALLVDGNTGLVLYDKNANTQQYPASITKIMVALLVLEAVDRGELKMDQPITASAAALADLTEDSSTADIEEGETLTVEQLLYCLMVVSANEVGNIFAEALDGSIPAFVERMNNRAQELGCTNTHFANTSGLHDPQHYTSAWDIYLFTREALKHQAFVDISDAKSYVVPATNKCEERELHSTNFLISNWRVLGYIYDDAHGIKTGTTEEAGHCLVSSAIRGGRSLISVVLGASVDEEGTIMSFTETSRLFDWGFDNFEPITVLEEERLYAVPVALSKETDTVMVHPQATTQVVLPKGIDPETDVIYTLDLPESVNAPVTAGDVLGSVTVSYEGQDYAVVPLLALSDVSSSSFLIWQNAVKEFLGRTIVKAGIAALLALIVLLVIWLKLIRPRRRYGRGGKRYRQVKYRGRRRR